MVTGKPTRSIVVLGGLLFTLAILFAQKARTGYALISGTVFNEQGFTVPGATVTLSPQELAKNNKQNKKQQAVSDARGEFSFRVPPVESGWILKASAKGLQTAEKQVDIDGEVRKDVTFQLSAESNEGK